MEVDWSNIPAHILDRIAVKLFSLEDLLAFSLVCHSWHSVYVHHVGLTPTSAGGLEDADRIFVGGLPYFFTEAQVRELLESFGSLREYELVKNRETGNSKGYAFCVYQDLSVTDIVCQALNGLKLGTKTLTVRQESVLQYAQQQVALQKMMLKPAGGIPTKVVCLTHAVSSDKLKDDQEYEDRIFVGGIPCYFTEAQVRELLEAFGSLREYDFVKDRETGNSKGCAFCVYQDLSVTDIVCETLNGLKLGFDTLTARRESVLQYALRQIALRKMMLQPVAGGLPTTVVCLTHAVSPDKLKDDPEEYEDIMDYMRQEGAKFGSLVDVVIPRPNPNEEPTPGLGKVFLEYRDVESSAKARQGMNGRKFGGNHVAAVFFPENKFAEGVYDC